MRKSKNVFISSPFISYFPLPCSSPGALSPLPGQHCSSDCAVPWMQQVNKHDSSTVPSSGQTSTHCWPVAVTLEPKSLGSKEHVQPLAYNPATRSPSFPRGTSLSISYAAWHGHELLWAVSWSSVLLYHGIYGMLRGHHEPARMG